MKKEIKKSSRLLIFVMMLFSIIFIGAIIEEKTALSRECVNKAKVTINSQESIGETLIPKSVTAPQTLDQMLNVPSDTLVGPEKQEGPQNPATTESIQTGATEGAFEYTDSEGGICITKYTGSDRNVVIPDKLDGLIVVSIGDRAFEYCSGLTSITIPNSVTVIGSEVFYYCSGLTSITIPNSVTAIGSAAFSGCSGLTSITIPNSVTVIGRGAFSDCSGLTSITIPNSVTVIGEGTFWGCSGLTSIAIPNSVAEIGNSTFFGCSGLTSIAIPNSVTAIGSSAFWGCSGLTSITIPMSVTAIGDYTFWGCNGLTRISVDINNLNYSSIGGVLFNKDVTTLIACPSKLTSITIPNSVTAIGIIAFWGCSGLTSITIPTSVTVIGDTAFYGCSGLTSITIPDSVTTIGYGVFSGCSGLTHISVDINNLNYSSIGGVLFNKDMTTLIACPSVFTSIEIPNSVKAIGDTAFYGCSGLTSITIPNSVTVIGCEAFYGCSGLTSITIPMGVIEIDYRAFTGCSGLTSITIPTSVTYIGEEAFEYCSGLTSITIPNRVTAIGHWTFNGCINLKKIRFDSPTTTIDYFSSISRTTTIIGYDPSAAKDYATEHGNPFEVIVEPVLNKSSKTIVVEAHEKNWGLVPVQDANVYVYEKPEIPMCIGKESAENKILMTGQTDASGKCTLKPPTGGWPANATVVACKNEVFKNDGRQLAREAYNNVVFTMQAHSLTIGSNGEWYGKQINSLENDSALILDSPRYLCNLSLAYYYNDNTNGDYYDDIYRMSEELSKWLSEATDGYFAIDNIAIYKTEYTWVFNKNGSRESQCDIQINDSSGTWSNSQVAGFYDDTKMNFYRNLRLKNLLGESISKIITDDGIKSNYRVEMSKKNVWDYDISDSYNYSKEALHELGHYILGCYDEYLDGTGAHWGSTLWNPHPSTVKNFGLMETEYDSIELSNDPKYAYLNTINIEDKSKITLQYNNNKGSCWDTLANKFPNITLKGKNPVESQSDVLSSLTQQDFFNIYKPNKERTYNHYDTNETIFNAGLPTFSVSENAQPSSELTAKIKVITQATGDQAVVSAIKGAPASLTQMFYDDTASVEIPLTADGTNFIGAIPVQKERYYLRLVTRLDNNETCYSDFVVRSTKDTLQSNYISDDQAICVSIDSATADSYNFISQDDSISRDGYVPLAKAVYITSKDKATVNDSILVSDVGSSTLVDTSTIAWYKFENDQWSPLETQKQDGDYNSITVWCSISGDGYYQLMAQPAKTTSTFLPVQGMTITANNQYDGSVNIAFTDANNKDAIRYYQFYYSDQPFSTDNLNTASVQTVDTFGNSYGYTFEDNTKTYYGAIQIVGKDGSVSDLSEVKSFTTGIRDTDNDGIPETWIEQYSLRTIDNQDAAIAGLDNDSDGLTNQQEYQNGTNPQKKDTDDDGVPDSDELAKGLNPLQTMTGGSTSDYLAAYGSNDFTVENVQISSENGTNTLSISLKNFRNTPAKDVNVKLLFDGNVEWFWQVDFEANKNMDLFYVFDGEMPKSIEVIIDSEQIRFDSNYSNNSKQISTTLDSIAITTPASKLNYQIGEALDLSGLVVTGTYSDGTTKVETITTDNITGFDSSNAAVDQVLIITVNGRNATYIVQINDSNERQLGDVDGNGSITAYDALMALQIATGKKTGTTEEITAADVDKSGSVLAFDALRILQYATGKITTF